MKVAVIGAGKVGAATVGNLMTVRGISEIVLIDQNKERVEGEILDFEHTTAYAHNPGANLLAGTYADCAGAEIIINTAGPSIQPGQTRIDLATINTKVLKSILQEVDYYNQEAILIMVTNPVDILTYGAYRLSSRPRNKILGTGTLIDSARLMTIIGKAYDIDPKNVFAYMLGEHGETSFAPWSIANICGLSLEEFGRMHIEAKLARKLIEAEVKNIGMEIFQKKGYTNHGIAAGIARLVIAILSDEKSILPVSVNLEGEYGLSDVALSVPCILGKNGVEKILEFKLTLGELAQLQNSAEFLQEVTRDLSY